MKLFLMMIIATGVGFGQSAKVIQLSPADAKQAKALDDEQKSLAEKVKAFEQRIRDKYLTKPEGENGSYVASGWFCLANMSPCSNDYEIRYYKDGWFGGDFQYSDDFKFIVPVAPHVSPLASCPYVLGNAIAN